MGAGLHHIRTCSFNVSTLIKKGHLRIQFPILYHSLYFRGTCEFVQLRPDDLNMPARDGDEPSSPCFVLDTKKAVCQYRRLSPHRPLGQLVQLDGHAALLVGSVVLMQQPLGSGLVHRLDGQSLHLRYQQSVTLTVLLAFSRQMR